MNAQPHTHKLGVYEASSGSVHLIYGDQEQWIHSFGIFGRRRIFTVEQRLPRAIRKLKKRHDQASAKAGFAQAHRAVLLAEAREYIEKAGWEG